MSEFSRKQAFDRRGNERYAACDDAVQVSPLGPEKSTAKAVLFSVIFACGELYCFAVIFGFTPSDIARCAVFANIISLFASAKNITFAVRKTYHIERKRDISLFPLPEKMKSFWEKEEQRSE